MSFLERWLARKMLDKEERDLYDMLRARDDMNWELEKKIDAFISKTGTLVSILLKDELKAVKKRAAFNDVIAEIAVPSQTKAQHDDQVDALAAGHVRGTAISQAQIDHIARQMQQSYGGQSLSGLGQFNQAAMQPTKKVMPPPFKSANDLFNLGNPWDIK